MAFDEITKTVLATLIITFTFGVATSVTAAESQNSETIWLWSQSSHVSLEAAEALGNGNMTRGLRLSKKALKQAEDKRERLIAHHNLCIAHASRARTHTAMRHCQEVRRIADDGFVVAGFDTRTPALVILQANLDHIGHPGLGKLPR